MSDTKQIQPPSGYRHLAMNEIIREGDLVFGKDDRWIPTGIRESERIRAVSGYYARKIEESQPGEARLDETPKTEIKSRFEGVDLRTPIEKFVQPQRAEGTQTAVGSMKFDLTEHEEALKFAKELQKLTIQLARGGLDVVTFKKEVRKLLD